MMASKSNIIPQKIQPSISPSGTFYSSALSSSSMARSLSPNRTSVDNDRHGYVSSSSPVSSSVDHRNASSPGHNSIASSSTRERNQSSNHRNSNKARSNGQKKTCMCSPTTHPGSFRCSLHRNVITRNGNQSNNSNRFHGRRSATMNSLMRVGTEGDLVKRSLASLMIRPSTSPPHQQKRRGDFQPKPSRLSVMSKADD